MISPLSFGSLLYTSVMKIQAFKTISIKGVKKRFFRVLDEVKKTRGEKRVFRILESTISKTREINALNDRIFS